MYEIKIDALWPEEGNRIDFRKNYGNCFSGSYTKEGRKETIESIRSIIKNWEEHDSIVQRMGNKVTPKNTVFQSGDITLEEVLYGQTRLGDTQ